MPTEDSGARTRRLKRAEYYVDIGITVTTSMLAGMTMIVEHPELAEPLARGALAGFFALMSIVSVRNARNNWLRLHGVSPIAVEMDHVTEDWGNE